MCTRTAVLAALTIVASACVPARDGGRSLRGAGTSPAPAETTAYAGIPIVSAAGQAMPLSDVLGEHAALVSFWAPWCEPCLKEMPDLERLARAARPCAVSVLAVAVGETPVAVARFAEAHHLTIPQFADEHYALADALGQTRVPTTVVFDRAHRITFVGERLDRGAADALAAAAASAGCALAAR
jgi:thiol-disulfide isomerase/thioredoxin